MTYILETPKPTAERVGLSIGAINRLMNDGKLFFVRIGTRRRIPPGAWLSDAHIFCGLSISGFTDSIWRD